MKPSKSINRSITKAKIKDAASRFAAKWEGPEGIKPTKESAHDRLWWIDLFEIFDLPFQTVADFQVAITNLKGNTSQIDVFYPGVLIGEHKKRGCTDKEFDEAKKQAVEYVQDFARAGKQHELPKFIVLSDFETIIIYKIEIGYEKPFARFKTVDLTKNIDSLMFLAGEEAQLPVHEENVDIKAVSLLGKLHDAMKGTGYTDHILQQFLARCLFCLFAEDTDIFPDHDFHRLVKATHQNGSDLGTYLTEAFRVLNSPMTGEGKRPSNLNTMYASLPYVNGGLFQDDLGILSFTEPMRKALLECCDLDWSAISPAVFGSLFQCIMDKGERRSAGAHYTSEVDILKVIRGLFLDELEQELRDCGSNKSSLDAFHKKIAKLKFLDPACGCGNFLVCTYKELRRLERELLEITQGQDFDPGKLKVSIGQFFGIEILEWPAKIAEVALILAERQADQKVLHGITFTRLPLKKSANIHFANALRIDWNQVLPQSECSFVLGNPPFAGGKKQSDQQKEDMDLVTEGIQNAGLLDYVTSWYFVASKYLNESVIRCAFVSTNGLCHGEQVGVLWEELLKRGIKIHFAYRTFPWESEARGKAHVHVVIIGFGNGNHPNKRIYDHDSDGEVTVLPAKNISPYLVEGSDSVITNRSKPICDVPEICFGNQPIDGGGFLMTKVEKDALLKDEPNATKWIRPFIGAEEFINGAERYCLWLLDIEPSELRSMPKVLERVESVRKFRLMSKREATRDLAKTPSQFAFISHPNSKYVVVPAHSSEKRSFIPLGFLDTGTIAGNSCLVIPNATIFHFGVLTSTMHMSWVRQVCGRIKSDYRYSNKLVYNNYPFPQNQTPEQYKAVEEAAQAVLDTRAQFKGQTLADLYDPNTMPAELVKAHEKLDRAVDKCYRKAPFTSERERVEFLFALYGQLSVEQIPKAKPRKKRSISKGL